MLPEPVPAPAPATYHAPPEYVLPPSGVTSASTYPDPVYIPHLRPFHEETHHVSSAPLPSVRRSAPETSPTTQYASFTPFRHEAASPPSLYPAAPPESLPSTEAGLPDEEASRVEQMPSPQRRSARPPKHKERDDEDDDDEAIFRPRKVARKTQIACFFCRGKASNRVREIYKKFRTHCWTIF